MVTWSAIVLALSFHCSSVASTRSSAPNTTTTSWETPTTAQKRDQYGPKRRSASSDHVVRTSPGPGSDAISSSAPGTIETMPAQPSPRPTPPTWAYRSGATLRKTNASATRAGTVCCASSGSTPHLSVGVSFSPSAIRGRT